MSLHQRVRELEITWNDEERRQTLRAFYDLTHRSNNLHLHTTPFALNRFFPDEYFPTGASPQWQPRAEAAAALRDAFFMFSEVVRLWCTEQGVGHPARLDRLLSELEPRVDLPEP